MVKREATDLPRKWEGARRDDEPKPVASRRITSTGSDAGIGKARRIKTRGTEVPKQDGEIEDQDEKRKGLT